MLGKKIKQIVFRQKNNLTIFLSFLIDTILAIKIIMLELKSTGNQWFNNLTKIIAKLVSRIFSTRCNSLDKIILLIINYSFIKLQHIAF